VSRALEGASGGPGVCMSEQKDWRRGAPARGKRPSRVAAASGAALLGTDAAFRAAADSSPALIWMMDSTKTVVFTNRRYNLFFGAASSANAAERWLELIHPDDAEEFTRAFNEAFAAARSFTRNVRIKHPVMGERLLNCAANPHHGGDGAFLGFVGVNVDLTEALQAQEVLREQTRTLETINSIAAALAGELDLERLVQNVTDASVELTGAKFGAFFYNVTDEAGESFMLYTLSGVERSAFADFPMPRNTEVFGPTFRGERIVRSGDISKDERYGRSAPYHGMPEGHLPVRSYLAVPVTSRSGQVLGGLFFGHPETDRFSARHERLIAGIAAQAAIAIDNAQLFQAAQHEIEQRRRAEAQIRDSEARLRLAVQASPFPTMLHAEDGEVLELSRKWSELSGYARSEIRTHFDWFRLAYPDRFEEVAALMEREFAQEGELAIGEVEIRAKDGTRRIWDFHNVRVGRLPDGRRLQISAASDVTDRRRWEDRLRESEARFRTLAENLPALCWIAEADGAIVWYNNRWYEYTGTTPEAMKGWGWQIAHHPEVLPIVLERWNVSIRTGQPFEMTFPLMGADGQYRPFLTRVAPVRDEAGAIVRWIGTNFDIAEQQRHQRHLQLMVNELNHRVKNTLAVVQAIAQQTFGRDTADPAARDAFEGRLAALASAHNLLTQESWEPTSLLRVVKEAVHAHNGNAKRFTIEGPDIAIEPKAGVTLAIALHELCANATKYGALSVSGGRVTIRWIIGGEHEPRLKLVWRETNGPPVTAPSRRGFGSRMIERALAAELHGTAKLEFPREGLVAEIDAPLPRIAVASENEPWRG